MKTKHLLLIGIIVVLSSCSAVYRTSQTPDDVYYSPAPPQNDYVHTDNQQDRDSYGYNNNSFNREHLAISRGIREPIYRNTLSFSLGYGYDPYNSFDYGYNSYNYYNPYGYYNQYTYPGVTFYPYAHDYYGGYYSSPFYNYYQPPFYIPQPGTNATFGPRKYNLGVYNPTVSPLNNHPGQSTTTNSAPVRTFSTTPANGTGVGNFIRRVIFPSNNNSSGSYRNTTNNSDNSTPARSFQTNTSSGSSSSSSSGSGGSAPVRTFRK
jgi:hypothetical protein